MVIFLLLTVDCSVMLPALSDTLLRKYTVAPSLYAEEAVIDSFATVTVIKPASISDCLIVSGVPISVHVAVATSLLDAIWT